MDLAVLGPLRTPPRFPTRRSQPNNFFWKKAFVKTLVPYSGCLRTLSGLAPVDGNVLNGSASVNLLCPSSYGELETAAGRVRTGGPKNHQVRGEEIDPGKNSGAAAWAAAGPDSNKAPPRKRLARSPCLASTTQQQVVRSASEARVKNEQHTPQQQSPQQRLLVSLSLCRLAAPTTFNAQS